MIQNLYWQLQKPLEKLELGFTVNLVSRIREKREQRIKETLQEGSTKEKELQSEKKASRKLNNGG